MTKAIYILSLLSLFLVNPLIAQSDSAGTLEIEFTGILTKEGQIAININTPAENFPKEPGLEIQFNKEQMQNGALTVEIDSLEYGLYAISVLDDLNGNLEMDMFLGFPKEGYGFSLNPEFKLFAPKFKDCSFELNQPNQKITIHMQYPRRMK
jgi:uncharacterized protein (DUF2141 family)